MVWGGLAEVLGRRNELLPHTHSDSGRTRSKKRLAVFDAT